MAVLEGLVIVTIILAGIWVGYHAWDEEIHSAPEDAKAHDVEPAQILAYADPTPHITARSIS